MIVNVTQILKPIRLAFFIPPNNDVEYLRVVRICSFLWGGVYFPILPFYRRMTREVREAFRLYENQFEFYSNTIENYDPDFVVTTETDSLGDVEKVVGDRTIIFINELQESLYSGESKYGIAIDEILASLAQTEFKYERTDSLKVVLPKVKKKDLFSSTLFGSLHDRELQKLKEISFPKKYISFPAPLELDYSYLSDANTLDYLKLGQYYIQQLGNSFWSSQTAVFFLDTARLLDLIIYWNLRALGWYIIAIPRDSYNDDSYKELIKMHQENFVHHCSLINHISVLSGSGIEENEIESFCTYINNIQCNPDKPVTYVSQWWIPRFWMDRKYLNYDKTASVLIQSRVKKHTLSETENISLPLLIPKFGNKYTSHIAPRFVNEIIYQFDDIEAKYAQIIPAISSKELNKIVKGFSLNQWRFSENGMFFMSNSANKLITFSIPTAKNVFTKWFNEQGYKLRRSSVGKLGDQLLRNIGGIYGIHLFANPGILPVLSLFDNGKTVKSLTLFTELNKHKSHFRFLNHNQIIDNLIKKRIIQFGVELQCPTCDQHCFYNLSEFKEQVTCSICSNSFFIPSNNPNNIKWAYKGIGPFSRNNRSDGIVSVLLTMRFFRIALDTDSITPILNFEILKNENVVNEVDFATFYQKFRFSTPDLFYCECKTEKDFEQKDVDRMESLAKMFPKSILVFATLKIQLSENEQSMLAAFARKFRKGMGSRPINPVLILTGNELFSRLGYDGQFKHLIIPHAQLEDEIGHLCDVTTQHYLGLPSFMSEVQAKIEERRKKN